MVQKNSQKSSFSGANLRITGWNCICLLFSTLDYLFVHFQFLIGSSSVRFCAAPHNASGSLLLYWMVPPARKDFFQCFFYIYIYRVFFMLGLPLKVQKSWCVWPKWKVVKSNQTLLPLKSSHLIYLLFYWQCFPWSLYSCK